MYRYLFYLGASYDIHSGNAIGNVYALIFFKYCIIAGRQSLDLGLVLQLFYNVLYFCGCSE